MAVLFLVVFFVSSWSVRLRLPDASQGFLSRDFCDAVKGICILLVFVRHVWPYVENAGYVSPLFCSHVGSIINGAIGQLLVAPFLFFSGFGVMESVKIKGSCYVHSMPRRRLLSTMLNFDVAVLFFALLSVLIGLGFSLRRLMLSLIGWSDVGNSNWYIFDIVVLYALFWISFAHPCHFLTKYIREDNKEQDKSISIIAVTLLSVLLAVILNICGKRGYWYNTILCFPAGVWFSHYSPILKEQTTSQKRFRTLIIVSAMALVLAQACSIKFPLLSGNAAAILFACFVALLSTRLSIDNRALRWLGQHLFPVYIYQRLPMIAFSRIGDGQFAANHPYLFVLACFIATLVLASVWHHFAIRLK